MRLKRRSASVSSAVTLLLLARRFPRMTGLACTRCHALSFRPSFHSSDRADYSCQDSVLVRDTPSRAFSRKLEREANHLDSTFRRSNRRIYHFIGLWTKYSGRARRGRCDRVSRGCLLRPGSRNFRHFFCWCCADLYQECASHRQRTRCDIVLRLWISRHAVAHCVAKSLLEVVEIETSSVLKPSDDN
jgi:hypothetical protein